MFLGLEDQNCTTVYGRKSPNRVFFGILLVRKYPSGAQIPIKIQKQYAKIAIDIIHLKSMSFCRIELCIDVSFSFLTKL